MANQSFTQLTGTPSSLDSTKWLKSGAGNTVVEVDAPVTSLSDSNANTAIDNRIAGYARANSPSGTIADAQIPSTIARTSALTFTGLTGTPANYGSSGQILETDGSTTRWVAKPMQIDLAATTSKDAIKTAFSEMLTGNTETGITVAYQTDDKTLDFTVNDFNLSFIGDVTAAATTINDLSDTTITTRLQNNSNVQSVVEDIVGDMVESNTESGITVTHSGRKLNFSVPTQTAYSTFASLTDTPAISNSKWLGSGSGTLEWSVPAIGDLSDVPSAFGAAGQILRVNTARNALEYYTPTDANTDTFAGLTDTPSLSSGDANKHVVVNAAGDALVFADAPTDTNTFIGLTDTPTGFAGGGVDADKLVKVNAAGTAIVFGTASWVVPSSEQIYDAVKSVVYPGNNATIEKNETTHRITIGATGGSGAG